MSEETFDASTAGDPVEVTYLPAEPTKSRVGSPEPQLLIPLIVMGGGADDKAPPPAAERPPLTDAELRALDARLAPPSAASGDEQVKAG